MNPFKQNAITEILFVSGTLRVTIQPSPHWLLLLFQAVIIGAFTVWSLRSWRKEPLLERLAEAGVVIAAIAGWVQQLFGFSEVVEFDPKYLRVRTEIFGWERIREYAIEECSDLELQDRTGNPHGLQCRLGWRTIEFGGYLSGQKAIEVLSALQDSLPDIATKLLPSEDISKHFTNLGLS